MDEYILAAIAAAFFCGGMVKGIVGIGLPLTSIALMTLFLDLRIAVPLLIVPVLTTNVLQALRGGRFVELTGRYWTMLVGGAIGVWVGAAALYRVDVSYLLCALGLVVGTYSLINLFAVRLSVAETSTPILSPIVGVFSGILAGTTGSIGVPIIIYFQALGLTKDIFVQAVGIQFLITGSILSVALVIEGGLNMETLPVSALAIVPAFAGMAVGKMVRDRVPEDRFRTGLFIFLLVIAFNMIRKGIF